MPKKRRADALSYWGEHCHLNTSSLMLTFSALRPGRDGKSNLWHRSGTVLLLRGAVIRDKAVRWQDGSLARWGDCVSCVSEMARYMKLTSDPMDRPIELRRVRASSCYRHCLVRAKRPLLLSRRAGSAGRPHPVVEALQMGRPVPQPHRIHSSHSSSQLEPLRHILESCVVRSVSGRS